MKFIKTLAFKRSSVVVFYALILVGSSVPGKKIPEIFRLTSDKLIHGAEYTIMGFFLVRWLSAELDPLWNRAVFFTLLIGATCAMLDELYQNLTPNRSPDFYDWCLDVVGISLSIPLYTFWRKKIFIE